MSEKRARRRRLTRWAVLWLAIFNFLLWSHYARRPAVRPPAPSVRTSSS